MTDRPPALCPVCGKQAAAAQRPFCGTRCADVDLGRWLTGQYRVPGPPADEGDGEQEEPALGRNAGA